MDWLLLPDRWRKDGLATQLRFSPGTVLEHPTPAELLVRHRWGAEALAGVSDHAEAVLRRLAAGWTATDALDPAPGAEGPTELAAVVWTLHRLALALELRLLLDGRPLLTVEPVSSAAALPTAGLDPAGRGLSRFAFLQRDSDREALVLASAVSAHRVVPHDRRTIELLVWLATEPDGPGHRGGAADAVLGLLADLGMLDGTEQSVGGPATDLAQLAEFPDLLLHQRSRFGTHDGPFGAEFPFLDRVDPFPAVRSARDGLVPLPAPDVDEVRARDPSLTEAIEGRCSLREYAEEPLTVAELGEFLFRCARQRGRYGPVPDGNMPYEASDRPYPSGGGVHDLEIYPLVTNVRGLDAGVYRYVPDRHALEPIEAPARDLHAVLLAAMRASAAPEPPPVLLKITSRFERMAWKYRAIGYSTTLKNVGALYQTMYLVATSMGLAACALGSGDETSGRRLLGPSASCELGVGEFMLGPAPAGAARRAMADRRTHHSWQSLVGPEWGRTVPPG